MNPKRAKYATLTTNSVKQEEVVPVLIHDPNAAPGEEYTYATFADENGQAVNIHELVENDAEAADAVASLEQQNEHNVDSLDSAQDIIIDENGQALTIQQLVENNSIEEVETVEESDGTHTILHIVPSSSSPGCRSGDSGEEGTVVIEAMEADTSIVTEAMINRSKNFFCTNCGNCYSAAGSLKLHMRACLRQREEVPPEQRKCTTCNKIFNSVAYLKEHMLRHTGDRPRRCTRCYRKFIDDEKYRAHMEMHKQQDKLETEAQALAAAHGGKKLVLKEFTCSFCSQCFTVCFDAGQVKRRYACDECREKYSNAEQLKRHKQMVDDKREFHCERCGRKFVFEGFLQRHLPNCDGTIKRRRDMK